VKKYSRRDHQWNAASKGLAQGMRLPQTKQAAHQKVVARLLKQ